MDTECPLSFSAFFNLKQIKTMNENQYNNLMKLGEGNMRVFFNIIFYSKLWFFCNHVQMWELNRKEDWAWNNWCFWIVVLEKTHESPSDSKRSNQSILKEFNSEWIFIGRTDAKTEALILWPPDANSRLTGKGPDAGKDWGQEEKGTTEDEMVGWHH